MWLDLKVQAVGPLTIDIENLLESLAAEGSVKLISLEITEGNSCQKGQVLLFQKESDAVEERIGLVDNGT